MVPGGVERPSSGSRGAVVASSKYPIYPFHPFGGAGGSCWTPGRDVARASSGCEYRVGGRTWGVAPDGAVAGDGRSGTDGF